MSREQVYGPPSESPIVDPVAKMLGRAPATRSVRTDTGGLEVFARIVFFTPLAIFVLGLVVLFLPGIGMWAFFGYAIMGFVLGTWWLWGLLSLAVVVAAILHRGPTLVVGCLGGIEAVGFAIIGALMIG